VPPLPPLAAGAFGQEPTLVLRWSGSAVEWAADTCQGHELFILSPELCAADFVLAMEAQRGVGEGR
jgi:hypothetical protein